MEVLTWKAEIDPTCSVVSLLSKNFALKKRVSQVAAGKLRG